MCYNSMSMGVCYNATPDDNFSEQLSTAAIAERDLTSIVHSALIRAIQGSFSMVFGTPGVEARIAFVVPSDHTQVYGSALYTFSSRPSEDDVAFISLTMLAIADLMTQLNLPGNQSDGFILARDSGSPIIELESIATAADVAKEIITWFEVAHRDPCEQSFTIRVGAGLTQGSPNRPAPVNPRVASLRWCLVEDTDAARLTNAAIASKRLVSIGSLPYVYAGTIEESEPQHLDNMRLEMFAAMLTLLQKEWAAMDSEDYMNSPSITWAAEAIDQLCDRTHRDR